MAWIESHQSLRQHPKLLKAARYLGISKVTLIGHLHCLWWWALDYAQSGDLAAYSAEDIAEAAEWSGDAADFVHALADVARIGEQPGFLEYASEGALQVHDWWDYAGKLLDRRKADAERKRTGRAPEGGEQSAGRPRDIRGTSAGSLTDGVRTVPTVPTVPTEPTKPDQPVIFQPTSSTVSTGRGIAERRQELNATVPAKQRVLLVDALLDLTGLRRLADSHGPDSERTLTDAHEKAVTLWGMDYRAPEQIAALADVWAEDWRGAKNTRPTMKQVIELASTCKAQPLAQKGDGVKHAGNRNGDLATDTHDNEAALRRLLRLGPDEPIPDE